MTWARVDLATAVEIVDCINNCIDMGLEPRKHNARKSYSIELKARIKIVIMFLAHHHAGSHV